MGEKREKFNVKDKLNGDILDFSLTQLSKVPIAEIVSTATVDLLIFCDIFLYLSFFLLHFEVLIEKHHNS